MLDVCFSLNRGILHGLLAAMNSLRLNTARLDELRVNIAAPPEEVAEFEEKIAAFFAGSTLNWRVGAFHEPAYLGTYLEAKFSPMTPKRRLSRQMQYGRMYFREIFPDVERMLYLDADVVVLADIAELFDTVALSADNYLAATPNFFPAIFHFGNPIKALPELRRFRQTFNSGVLFTDLRYWTADTERLMRHYLDWDASCRYGMLNSGDETLLNVMFKGYHQLPARWNRSGYGNMRWLSYALMRPRRQISILHWSGGHHKPWGRHRIPYRHIWQHYAQGPASITAAA